ncbi:hypothetical protein MFLAVUS_003612 [Mucor flavus]|uniref:Translocon-associated protein subunit beta n=1 Tax=Mucor flavus TaxID=439312 RepID=A0ABP9YTL5_9FUNG
MSSIRFIQAFVFALFFCQCLAQIGTKILAPETNATISVGDKVQIQYTYGNMGNGSYVVDLALWKDNAAEDLAQNIATNVGVKSGNSAGTKLDFLLNSTYEWTVPKGLADTVYLTVTTKPELESQVGLTMRSSPIRLHISAALTNLPIQKLSLLALAMGVLFFTR